MYRSGIPSILLLLILPVAVFGQANFRTGTIPQLNVNIKIAESWKLNTKLEARQIFFEKEPGSATSRQLRYERTDLSTVLTRKVSADNTVGAGYLVRREGSEFTHRLIQQFSNVKNFEVISLAHRIVTDETFSPAEPVEFRARYRLGIEMPLNGRQIDPREFYSKVNNEYLGLWSDGEADLEIRGLLALGYNATDSNKIELGFEYRVNEFDNPAKAQQFWLTIGWFVSI
ncbi:hypothetical protein DYBT9623_04340 [Dyadobacter sp. CECT 9623]|uniref:DUF2490 domain-containing protein n=1 Tax=Dyadobacter linearis TaxID=2823330 RepID=A0ABN7RGH1_9BACT|nr:DUF2490 domain-containing protein [Dyadobacter sp. CECT 9623]CAG5072800.1 hypothetical protein DYBT9623_04340 [Dyadobacter sp. CECT 9623]